MLDLRGTAGTAAGMARIEQATTIKQYENRRLYNTATASYVAVEDLAAMVEDDEDFVVYEAKTGEDITRSVLKRIILERSPHG
jgi:polyhydroxyalkanoate synthesis repressor PhaR